MRAFHRVVAALAFALSPLASPAASVASSDYSDLWWNPAESGWGVNVVQQEETAFVTVFLYDRDGKPAWYVASDARIVAYQGSGPIFSGTLYRTAGPWHGGAFDPAQVRATAVGQVSLEVLARDRLRLHYSADGVSGVKELVRQTFAAPSVAANYEAQFRLRQSFPGGPPIGTFHYQGEMLVHFDSGTGFVRVLDNLGNTCQYRGTYVTAGRFTRFTGQYLCSGGDAGEGSFEMSDLEISDYGLMGALRTTNGRITQTGRFAAVRY